MTTIYTNNYVFPQEDIGSMSAKQQIRELRKHPLITNFQNMKQCKKTLNCPKLSNKHQHKQIADVKMLTSNK